MKNDLAENYSIKNWLKTISSMKPIPKKRKTSWKATVSSGIVCVLVGFFFISINWDGLSEWWKIVNMSYFEVKDTPYLPIWTSGRGMQGIFFIIIGCSYISRGLENRKRKKSEQAPAGDSCLAPEE